MDTQNTPVHLRLWHRGFWLLAFANMLLTMSVYMLIPLMGDWMKASLGLSPWLNGCLMGVYGVGLYLLGPLCSWWVQRYRRNHICQLSILGMLLVMAAFWLMRLQSPIRVEGWQSFLPWQFGLLRLLLGAAFGLAQMVLCSTLIIDVCESFQRTEANHSAAWFGRFAVALGPMTGLLLMRWSAFVPESISTWADPSLVAVALALLAAVLIMLVPFPFRAPDDSFSRFSLDRFFLTDGWLLFANLLPVTAVVGMVFATECTPMFYAMMMTGFFIALLAEKFVFADADLKSQTISGLILLLAAALLMRWPITPAAPYLAPVCLSIGVGIIGSRFLLFFIKLSHHCQRGTSQSTFFLAWETGISIGLLLGYALPAYVFQLSLVLIVAAFLLYHFITHNWYLKHKNR